VIVICTDFLSCKNQAGKNQAGNNQAGNNQATGPTWLSADDLRGN
jgi:hypothetical protein